MLRSKVNDSAHSKKVRQSSVKFQMKNNETYFEDDPRISRILSTYNYWRSIYRKFRTEMKFVYCVTDHFMKIDYIIDSVPDSYDSEQSIEYEDSDIEVSTNKEDSGLNVETPSAVDMLTDKSAEQSLCRTDLVNFNHHNHTSSIKNSLNNNNIGNDNKSKRKQCPEVDMQNSLVEIQSKNNLTERFLTAVGTFIYWKNWIDDIIDSFGIFNCTKNYLWALFLRWIDS